MSFIGRVRPVFPDRECAAWYSELCTPHPHRQYLTGGLLEAERANSNGQFFKLDDLKSHLHTLVGSPLNLGHNKQQILGSILAAEIVYPQTTATATARYDKPGFILDEAEAGPQGSYSWFAMNEAHRGTTDWLDRGGDEEFARVRNLLLAGGSVECAALDHPYVEILATWIPAHFPTLAPIIEQGMAAGTLSYSMECVPDFVEPVHPDGSFGDPIPYDGFPSATYPPEVNSRTWGRALTPPTFVGTAILLPGVTPGWKDAFVNEAASEFTHEVATNIEQETPMPETTTSEEANLGSMTASDFKKSVKTALRSASGTYVYVDDFDATSVYVEMDGPSGSGYYAFAYAVDGNGAISLSNPRPVIRSVSWTDAPAVEIQGMPAAVTMPPMAQVAELANDHNVDDYVTIDEQLHVYRVVEIAQHGAVEISEDRFGLPDAEEPAFRLEDLAGNDAGWHMV